MRLSCSSLKQIYSAKKMSFALPLTHMHAHLQPPPPHAHTHRSISLGHLRPTDYRAVQHHITKSSQDLLYGSQPTEATDLQDDLDLDETMFEKTPLSHDKVHSENDINEPNTLFPRLADRVQLLSPPIGKISERCDKQGDSHYVVKGQGSRRASNSSYLSDAQSDFSSDFIASQASSSLLKSVRFDVDELDSGVVTGTSTPHHPERRASAPEFKASSSVVRRGSAPECKTVSFSGGKNEGDSSDAVDSDPDQTEGEGRMDRSGCSIDKMSTFAESSNIDEQHVTEEWDTRRDSEIEVSSLQYSCQAENHETVKLSVAQVEGADSPTTKRLREADDHTPPTVTIATDQRHSSPRKIAQLISAAEQWRSAPSGEAEGRPKHEVSRLRVAHMKQVFQQQQLHTVEKNAPVTKQVSKLVTEKAKVFQGHVKQEERLSVVKDPPKLKVLLDHEESKQVEGDSEPTLMSPKLGASPPQLDLSDESEGGEGKEDGNGTQNETSSGTELGIVIDESKFDLSNHDNLDENNEQEEEDDMMRRFERSRLSSIPVFACPVNLSPWQPIHLTENDEEADSSGDEDMVQPLRPQTGLASFSPFGKGLFSQRSRSPISPQVRFQLPGMRETKRIQHPALEPFYRPQGFQRTAAVNRLSSIPEETPEMCSSTHDVLSLCT